MNVQIKTAKSFRRDYKKLSAKDVEATDEVVQLLAANKSLPVKYRDHSLHGNYEGYRECHIRPDLLLVYSKNADNEIIIYTLYRVNSHTNIFDISKSK